MEVKWKKVRNTNRELFKATIYKFVDRDGYVRYVTESDGDMIHIADYIIIKEEGWSYNPEIAKAISGKK